MRKRRAKQKNKDIKCTFCGERGHTKLYCWKRPRNTIKVKRPIRAESVKTRLKRYETADQWFKDNPSNKGWWDCYLQISPLCPKRVNRNTITLEHVYARNKYPELKYSLLNIKPSCSFCNELKRSNTPQQLAYMFVNVAIMISKPEWKAWEKEVAKYSSRLAIQLGLVPEDVA